MASGNFIPGRKKIESNSKFWILQRNTEYVSLLSHVTSTEEKE